jgi:hypothetical protein
MSVATTNSPLIESEASQLARAAVDTQANTGPVAGPLHGALLHLGMANTPISGNTPYSTLSAQEADFTGYTAAALTWDVPSTASDNTVQAVSTPVVFRPTDAVTPNVVYNIWVSNSGGTIWYLAGVLVGGPFPMGTATDQMIITVIFCPATNSYAVTIS